MKLVGVDVKVITQMSRLPTVLLKEKAINPKIAVSVFIMAV